MVQEVDNGMKAFLKLFRQSFLFRWLVVPLSLSFVLLLYLAFTIDNENSSRLIWAALVLNLATESISIIFTVIFVDRVLRRHQAQQEVEITIRLNKALLLFHNKIHAHVTFELGLDSEFVERLFGLPASQARVEQIGELLAEGGMEHMVNTIQEQGVPTQEQAETQELIVTYTQERVIAFLPQLLDSLDNDGWYQLIKSLKAITDDIDTLIRRFGNYIPPIQHSAMIDAEQAIAGVAQQHYLIAGLIGRNPTTIFPGPGEVQQREKLDSTQTGVILNSAFHLGRLLEVIPVLRTPIEENI